MSPYRVTAFYKFVHFDVDQVTQLQKMFQSEGDRLTLNGLLILATEGINGTIAGSALAIEEFELLVSGQAGEVLFKRSESEQKPFKRFKVKIREEIVTLGDRSISPKQSEHKHLSPAQWEAMMREDDVVMIDTRNDYETAIGMFDGAVDPKLKTFQEFPDFVKQADIPKDKKVMLYCTGGIRCEKAILEMERQGYKHVYQLKGGILEYLRERPEGKFVGECFVFDHRAAVDRALQPSQRYTLCPHCGDPGDVRIVCQQCSGQAVVCGACDAAGKRACSKNCIHLLRSPCVS